MEALPEEKKAVSIQERRQAEFVQAILELNELLARESPEKVTPRWIKDNALQLYRKLFELTLNWKEQPEWIRVAGRLDQGWQDRWSDLETRPSKMEKRLAEERRRELRPKKEKILVPKEPPTLEQSDLMKMSELLSVTLEDLQPREFNPAWVSENNKKVFFWMKDKKVRGLADWGDLISQLNEQWRTKWAKRRTYKEVVPENEYSDPAEVAQAIENDRLYVFSLEKNGSDLTGLMISHAEVRQERQEIIEKLIELSKKGNVSASDTLIGLLMPIVESWQENNEQIGKFVMDKDALEEKIRRCVFLYQKDKEFLTYLYASLFLQARQIKTKLVSMDAPLKADEAGSMHDRLGQEDAAIGREAWEEEETEESAVQIASKKRGRTGIAA